VLSGKIYQVLKIKAPQFLAVIHETQYHVWHMYRAEVEPMPSNPPDRLPRTGLWKVAIYEGDRFVRTDKDNIVISEAERLAENLNYQFGIKKKARGA
jgi:hypothetical protein